MDSESKGEYKNACRLDAGADVKNLTQEEVAAQESSGLLDYSLVVEAFFTRTSKQSPKSLTNTEVHRALEEIWFCDYTHSQITHLLIKDKLDIGAIEFDDFRKFVKRMFDRQIRMNFELEASFKKTQAKNVDPDSKSSGDDKADGSSSSRDFKPAAPAKFDPEGPMKFKDLTLTEAEEAFRFYDDSIMQNAFQSAKKGQYASSIDVEMALKNLGIQKSLAHVNDLLKKVQQKHDIGKVTFEEFRLFVRREEAKMIRESSLVEDARATINQEQKEVPNMMDGTFEAPESKMDRKPATNRVNTDAGNVVANHLRAQRRSRFLEAFSKVAKGRGKIDSLEVSDAFSDLFGRPPKSFLLINTIQSYDVDGMTTQDQFLKLVDIFYPVEF